MPVTFTRDRNIFKPERRLIVPSDRPRSFHRTPRMRRWADRPFTRMMADGDVQLDSNGDRILNPSGDLVLKCPPSGPTPVNCGNCAVGTTPYQFTMTFAGVALQTACEDETTGGFSSGKFTTGSTFSGTFTVTQTGGAFTPFGISNPCVYMAYIAYSSQIATLWRLTGCSHATTLPSDHLLLELVKTSGTNATVRASFMNDSSDPPWDEGSPVWVFQRTIGNGGVISGFDCDVGGTFNNGFTAFAGTTFGSGGLALGKDGDVTITPV